MQSTMLIESLESVRRRVRVLAVTYGVGLVLAAAVGLLVASVAADWLLNLPAVPRTLLTTAAVAAVLYGLWRWLVRPLAARVSLNDVAGRVEQTYPQFQDRLRSTVDILLGREVPGSEVMKQRVVSEATRLTQSLDLSRVVVAKPVWYSTAGGLSAVVVLLALLTAVGPRFAHTALARLFLPFGAAAWDKTVEIEPVGSVPDRVTVGQRVDVNIRLARGDRPSRRATILYQYGDDAGHFGPVQQEYMTRGEDGVYHAAIDARLPEAVAAAGAGSGQIKVWTESGDDQTGKATIHVVQRLSLDRVEATITPPAYAGMPPVRVSLTQPVSLTAGSTVTVTAAFNKPLAERSPVTTELLTGGPADLLQWKATSPTTVAATFTAAESVRFHLHATDADGVTNSAAEEFELTVRPDQNPAVMILAPRRNEDCTATAFVPLGAAAEDDFGITTVSLMVERLGDHKRWEVPLVKGASAASADVHWARVDTTTSAGGGDLVRYHGAYTWDLAKALPGADLKPGDTLDYYLSARDNFALNGAVHPPAASGHLHINIISQDELTQQATDAVRNVADQTAILKRTQNDTQRQTSTLAKATEGKPQMDPADQVAADRLSAQQGTLASQAKSVADKLAEVQRRLDENRSPNNDLRATAKEVGDLLNRAAEGPMKGAANKVADAKNAPSADDRQQTFREAQTNQVQASEMLDKAMKSMGSIGSLSRAIGDVRELLADQQRLSAATAEAGKNTVGQSPDQMKPEDRAKLDAIAKEQQQLSDRTAKTLEGMQADAGKMAKSDPAASDAMKKAAETGQQQQVPDQQAKASKQASQNQQSGAQAAQKAAELGLQTMLADLREAEKHKLDELNRKLAELQEQVAVLIRRQSGHNLDTAGLIGPTTLDGTTHATLSGQAERDPVTPPPLPDVPGLSAQQEQTERNARDVAKAAEDLPDGAAPADHLTDAADQMERAIVHLRASRLAAAYSPPQVRALDALMAAKKVIDEQKKKSDQQQQASKKEVIRQQFIAIRQAQAAVNEQTTAIDAAPRNDDGSRRRADLIPLGELPGKQGAVADQAAKLEEPLGQLGSIVYTWADQDVIRHMRHVKDGLGQQQTDAVVQVEQKQVLAELDAIIADLVVKPEQSEFTQKAGDQKGGGGGKSSPGVPSEAELRLLKDLQVAENNATAELAKAAHHDKAEAMDLGTRQGDLRGLLDKLIQKASKGELKLPPEPDNREQLPEEKVAAGGPDRAGEKIDQQELTDDLIGGGERPKPKAAPDQPAADKPARGDGDQELAQVGGRMARVRQRLAINDDPGPITQNIQGRILEDLDKLIEEARKKEAQQQNTPPKAGDDQQQQQQAKNDKAPQPQPPQPAQQQANAQQPAQSANAGGNAAADPAGADAARQEARMWGSVAPRERQAVVESRGEQPLEKYKPLVDDYYRAMAIRAKASGQ